MVQKVPLNLLLLTVVAVASGCDSGPARVSLSGKVTYNGQPLTFGAVSLKPKGGGSLAGGEIGSDGSFTIQTFREGPGIKPGSYLVAVSCYEAHDPSKQWNSEAGLGKSLIPVDYASPVTSGLEVEVGVGEPPPLLFELHD